LDVLCGCYNALKVLPFKIMENMLLVIVFMQNIWFQGQIADVKLEIVVFY